MVLVKVLITEAVVGVVLPFFSPSLLMSLSFSLWLLWSWLRALYLPPQTSHLQRNYPRGRQQLALHSTAVGGAVEGRGRWSGREAGREEVEAEDATQLTP